MLSCSSVMSAILYMKRMNADLAEPLIVGSGSATSSIFRMSL